MTNLFGNIISDNLSSIIFDIVVGILMVVIVIREIKRRKAMHEDAATRTEEMFRNVVDKNNGGFITADRKYIIGNQGKQNSFVEFPLDKIAYVMIKQIDEDSTRNGLCAVELYDNMKNVISGRQFSPDRDFSAIFSGSFTVNIGVKEEVWTLIKRNSSEAVRVDERFHEVN